MMLANSVQKFAEFCFQDFEPVFFINLNCSFDYSFAAISNEFLMFSSLEIMELTLRAEILALNCMLLIELIMLVVQLTYSQNLFCFFLDSKFKHGKNQKNFFSYPLSNFPRVFQRFS